MTDEFLDDPCMMKLVRYILKRINRNEHIVKFQSNGWRNVNLKPYEFIFGRDACCKETGLTDREIRTRIARLTTSSFVRVSTSSSTSSFTVYRLMTESFKQNSDQQNDQQNDQQFDHKQEEQEIKETRIFDFKKEASKKENVHNFETPQPPKGGDAVTLPLFHKETKKHKASQEDIDAITWALHVSLEVTNVPPKTIRIWIEKYSSQRVVNSIQLLRKRRTPIKNKMGWIQNCLENRYDIEDQNMTDNKEFFMRFKEENGLNSLMIFGTVARDKNRDFEFDFKRNPDELQEYARRKYGTTN